MKKPKLSLCMIVKNEAEMLPRCLKSVKECVDEIVVVDTGSSDKTVEIAEGYGAKVFNHPWENDFSMHRNQSISYATGDWIMVMDADEELRAGDGVKIREAIAVPDIDSVTMIVVNFFNQGTSQSLLKQVRLFKRDPKIFYSGIVHNQLTGYRCPLSSTMQIYHYGYDLDPEQQQKKFERTSSLLKQQIAANPTNYWHRHNLAVSYASNFLFSEAIEEGLIALDLAEREALTGPNPLWTHYIVAASYLKLGRLDRAAAVALNAIEQSEDHLDSHFVLVLVYHQQKQWPEIEHHAKAYFRVLDLMESSPECFASSIINMAGEGWRVRLALGDVYLHRNEPEKALTAFETALDETLVAFECLQIIGDCYKTRSLWGTAAHFYQRSVKKKQDYLPALLGLALAKNRLGKKKEAIGYYEKVLSLQPETTEALVKLGDLYREQGEGDRAQGLYERALRLEPNLVNVSLGLAYLSVKKGDIETCVTHCENILKRLGLPCNHTLESLSDLAVLFLIIGHEFDKAGQEEMFKEAMEIAVLINPELVNQEMT